MKTIVFVAVLLIFRTAFCQMNNEFKPEFKIGGVVYTGWEFNADDRNFIVKLDSAQGNTSEAFGYLPVKNQFEISQNSFYLERAYMTIFASLTPSIKGRLTSDIYSITDGTGKTQYQLGIKFAWINWTAYKNESGFALDFTLGVIPNQWIMLNDKYYGYRSFGKTLTDYQWTTSAVRSSTSSSGIYSMNRTQSSYFPAADIGVNSTVTLPKGYGELYINIFNGNGFRNLSFDNRFKDFEALLFIRPLAGNIKQKSEHLAKLGKNRITGITDLTLGGFAYLGKLGMGENYNTGGVQYKRNRAGGMLHVKYNLYKIGFIKIGGEYSLQMNQDPSALNPTDAANVTARGISLYGEFSPPLEALNEKLTLMARYNIFDPDIDNNNLNSGFTNKTDKQTLLILGLGYRPAPVMMFGLSYQQTGYELPYVVDYGGKTHKSDSKLVLHASLEF